MATLLAAALGTWLGVQALRMALAMVIWNVAEDNTSYAGEVAAVLWIVGIVGMLLVPRFPVRRSALWLGAVFGGLVVLRQALPGENSSPALAFAAWAVWLWWLPAFVRLSSRAGRLGVLAPGVVLGVALQVAGQVALHGLDLELVQGPASVVAAALLALALVLAIAVTSDERADVAGGWGALAIGPYLFVQLTLLSSLGRLEQAAGLPPVVYELAVVAGFAAALLVLALPLDRRARIALALLAVILLVPGTRLGALEIVALVPIQAGLALGLAAAFTSGPRRLCGRIGFTASLGALVLFLLVFLFYSYRDRVDALWPLSGALVVAPGLLARALPRLPTFRPALAAVAALLGAMAIAAVPPLTAHPAAQASSPVAVLTYNLHQGLDYWSVPSAEALAARIESANADLVALQEVNRGWDLSAGIDMFRYLEWRLPQYHAVYGPMDTTLYGNAILSRYPIAASGSAILPHLGSVLMRGYVWADVDAPGGSLLMVSTHFTSYEGYDEERAAQADAYAAFWARRPRSILAGDYNSHPQDVSVRRLLGAGLVDAVAEAGLGGEFTYSSGDPHERIDYVFVSPDLEPASARILDGTASDHRPIFVVLRPR